MINPFEALDSGILNVCTRCSHRIQRSTGITNYFIAKIGIGISSFGLTVDSLNYFNQFLHRRTNSFEFFVDGVVFFQMIYRSVVCGRAEEKLSDIKPSELLYYLGKGWRLLWLLFFLIDINLFFFSSAFHAPHRFLEFVNQVFFSFGLVVFYYFIAVNPLPPGKSKVRQWIESLGHVLKPVTQEN